MVFADHGQTLIQYLNIPLIYQYPLVDIGSDSECHCYSLDLVSYPNIKHLFYVPSNMGINIGYIHITGLKAQFPFHILSFCLDSSHLYFTWRISDISVSRFLPWNTSHATKDITHTHVGTTTKKCHICETQAFWKKLNDMAVPAFISRMVSCGGWLTIHHLLRFRMRRQRNAQAIAIAPLAATDLESKEVGQRCEGLYGRTDPPKLYDVWGYIPVALSAPHSNAVTTGLKM